MRNHNRNRKLRRAAVVVILLSLAAAVPSTLHFLGPERPGPADPAKAVPQTAPTPPSVGEEPAGPLAPPDGPVIDYGRLEEEGPLDDLMDRRMADLGIGESLDMVVRPGESIKVGDTTVPMSEILDKIRIGKGGIVEETLGPTKGRDRVEGEDLSGRLDEARRRFGELRRRLTDEPPPAPSTEEIREYTALKDLLSDHRALRETEARIEENRALLEKDDQGLKRALEEGIDRRIRRTVELEEAFEERTGIPLDEAESPEGRDEDIASRRSALREALTGTDGPPPDPDRVREYIRLGEILDELRRLRRLRAEIREKERLMGMPPAAARSEIEQETETLPMKRRDLAASLASRLSPGSGEDLYGIHVVRPGDNVWNIHFGILKEYFAGRGVALSPAEDEPDARGVSSGVGRILKFSENMVSIYNLREHRLEPNLHLIHPLSKIVVFNLGRMLSILRLLDFDKIDRVSYDGEILWIPPAEP